MTVQKHAEGTVASTNLDTARKRKSQSVVPTPMEGSAAAAGMFPASRKTHVPGSLHPDLRVPMREIKLTPTSAGHGTAAPEQTANPPALPFMANRREKSPFAAMAMCVA